MTQLHRALPVAFVLLSVAAAEAQQPPRDESPVVITTGEGVIDAVPDRAFVTISAESRAKTPKEAQGRNAELMKPVQDRLRAAGIPAEAIRTVAYDLQFEWDYTNNKRVPRGYVARNAIEVRVDAVERLGELLDAAVGSGATSVGDIRFDLKDRAKLEREALRLAVADARARADAAAAGAGLSIDRVLRIEAHGGGGAPPMPMRMMRETAADASAPETPVSAGQIQIRSAVTLTSRLK